MVSNRWEEEVYSQSKQINRYPFDKVVSKVLSVKRNLPKPLTALDIGSGTGNHLNFFVDNGFDTTGIELSKSANKLAESFLNANNNKAKIYEGNIIFPEQFFRDEKFSFILDRGSLTHNSYKNVKNALGAFSKLMHDEGRFLSYFFSSENPSIKSSKLISDNYYTDFVCGIFKGLRLPTLFLSQNEDEILFGEYFKLIELNHLSTYNTIDQDHSSHMWEIYCKL